MLSRKIIINNFFLITNYDFTLRDGTVVKRDSMSRQSKDFSYFEANAIRLVRIPYAEGGCSMIVALPLDKTKHIGTFRN